MKKGICLLALALHATFNSAYAQDAAVSFGQALENSALYFSGKIPKGSRVALLNIQSDNIDLTDYVIDELSEYFVNEGSLIVVDRQNLTVLQQEMNLQLSGAVSDESAQAIGRKLGAQTIISGAISPFGDAYRLSVRAIEVETAALQGMHSEIVAVDAKLAALTKTAYKSAASITGTTNSGAGDFALDGKYVFAISATGMFGSGWGAGGTITALEKHNHGAFLTPSVFATAKYFLVDDDHRFFAGGAGILLKKRLAKGERLLFNVGVSLEFFRGSAEEEDDDLDDSIDIDIASLGMGIQGGVSYRLTPNFSLDLNGLTKFAFGSAEGEESGYNAEYAPFVFGAEIGLTYMFAR